MTENRPGLLTALCVLSWIWMGIFVYDLAVTLADGPLTNEEIKEQKLIMLEGYSEQDPELVETGAWVIEDTMGMLKVSQEKFSTIAAINGLQLLIGIVGVLFMFRLKKIGFHLYIVYSLISFFYWPYFFGEFSIGASLAILSGIFAVLFVVLYGFQSKHMKA